MGHDRSRQLGGVPRGHRGPGRHRPEPHRRGHGAAGQRRLGRVPGRRQGGDGHGDGRRERQRRTDTGHARHDCLERVGVLRPVDPQRRGGEAGAGREQSVDRGVQHADLGDHDDDNVAPRRDLPLFTEHRDPGPGHPHPGPVQDGGRPAAGGSRPGTGQAGLWGRRHHHHDHNQHDEPEQPGGLRGRAGPGLEGPATGLGGPGGGGQGRGGPGAGPRPRLDRDHGLPHPDPECAGGHTEHHGQHGQHAATARSATAATARAAATPAPDPRPPRTPRSRSPPTRRPSIRPGRI